MAVLNSTALQAIESKVSRWRENISRVPYGYPLSEISDMLDTIVKLKTEKKKWQRLAEHRGQVIKSISKIAEQALEQGVQ